MNKEIKKLAQAVGTNSIWKELERFNEISPTLDLCDKDIIYLLKAIERQEDRGGSHEVRKALGKWAEYQLNSAMELFASLIKINNTYLFDLAPVLAKPLSVSAHREGLLKEILALLNNSTSQPRSAGIRSVSSISNWNLKANEESQVLQEMQRLIQDLLEEARDYELLAEAANACFLLYSHLTDPDKLLLKLSEVKHPQIQYSIATNLWIRLKFDEYPELYVSLLMSLSAIDDSKKGLVDQIERTLGDIGPKHPDIAFKYFERWLKGRNLESVCHIREFKRVFEKIISSNLQVFQKWLTQAMLSNDSKRHAAAAEVVAAARISKTHEFQFEKEEIVSASLNDLKHLSFKAIGWIDSKRHLRSLIYSLLVEKVDDEKASAFLISIFYDPIMYNFPSTKEYLLAKKASAGTEAVKAIDAIIKYSDDYFEAIQGLPSRDEFSPSEKRLRAYHKLEQKKIREEMDKANNENSFMEMVSPILLKGGKYWFAKVGDTYSDRSELNHYEHSTELPRKKITDPVRWARLKYEFRRGDKK